MMIVEVVITNKIPAETIQDIKEQLPVNLTQFQSMKKRKKSSKVQTDCFCLVEG